jgi:glyoxylase-like metal-dependent hydrolase (beta-lactamase superfamily II)
MIDHVVTSGTFSLDGEDFAVDNNIWLVGDDSEVLIVDTAHDHQPILDAVAGRRVAAIVATHGHNDHINAGPALADATGAPILLHPDDRELWDQVHPGRAPDGSLADGDVLRAAGHRLQMGAQAFVNAEPSVTLIRSE